MLSPTELQQIHNQIVELRAETMRRAAEPIPAPVPASIPTLTAWELFWCPVLIAAGFVTVVATLTTVAIKLLT